MTPRPTTEEVLLSVAGLWALRGTCPRLSAGAVIATWEGHAVSAGYNGAPRGLDHCHAVGCLMEGGHCVRSVHAEENAILQAARVGISVDGCVLYVTHRPCVRCAIKVVQVGIQEVVYARPYGSDGLTDHVAKVFMEASISCRLGQPFKEVWRLGEPIEEAT